MFGIFKKKDPKRQLEKKYKQLLTEAFELSTINRTASDEKYAKADLIMKKLEELKNGT